MELSEADIEILDRFYRNELPEDDFATLKARMKDGDFADAVTSYLKTLSVIAEAGRFDLQQQLSVIQKHVEKSGYEKYKPSKGGGFGGSGAVILIMAVIIVITVVMFYTGRLNMETLDEVIPDSEKLDTVYHYNIYTDTIIVESSDSIQSINRSSISDTIYIRTPVRVRENDSIDSK
jgi:hypothetical protein